jgi:hypothetical protein
MGVAIVYGAANCAYQAVDWALAIHVLPDAQQAGKDMGIWHASFVLPQAVAPGLTAARGRPDGADRVKRSPDGRPASCATGPRRAKVRAWPRSARSRSR